MTLLRVYFWIASVLLGWALGRMLSSLTPQLMAGRARWPAETVLAAALVLLTIGFVWVDHWVMRPWPDPGRLASLLLVVKLFALHLAAAFVLPPLHPGAANVDLAGYYDRARRLTFLPLAVTYLAFGAFRGLAGIPFHPLELIGVLILTVICLMLACVRRRALNIIMLVATLVIMVGEVAAYALRPPVASASAGR